MAIPQQVRQQAQRTDELIQGQQAQSQQPADENEADSVEPAEQTVDQEQQPAEADTEDQQPEQQASSGDEEITVDSPDQLARQISDLETRLSESDQRYRTLQGMIKSSEEENQRLRTLIAQMNDGQQSAEQQQQQSSSTTSDQADPSEAKDREEFGDDFVDFVARVVDRRVSKLEQRFQETEGMAKKSFERVQKTDEQQFYETLQQEVPEWQELDNSDEFKRWLYQSNTRVALMKEAVANYEAKPVVEVFQLFKQLHGKGQPEQGTQEAPAGNDGKENRKRSLNNKVAPSKGRASNSNSASAEPKVWTRTEIAQVYANRRSTDPQTFAKQEREIAQAQKDGRVDYTQ